jgi:hypothetical protein
MKSILRSQHVGSFDSQQPLLTCGAGKGRDQNLVPVTIQIPCMAIRIGHIPDGEISPARLAFVRPKQTNRSITARFRSNPFR